MSYCTDVLEQSIISELETYLINHSWKWGFISAPHMGGSIPHWSIVFAGRLDKNVYPCEKDLTGIIKTVWDFISKKYFTEDDVLVRCYANAITQGLDQRIHTDDNYPGSKTFILYVNSVWNVDWGGETIVWDRENREIKESYLPKFNNGILISGNCWHGVRPVSSYCNNLRMTLMFKTRPKSFLESL